MRKIYILSLLLSTALGISQELTKQDALRYATENLIGTARFRGMSGAFGSVGGDLSAININPAGSSIFNHNMASFTGSTFNTNNTAKYFGTTAKENFSTLDLNQLGAVFVFTDNNSENDWKKFAIALNYENGNSLDDRLFAAGRNPSSSISNYFLNFAQGIPVGVLDNNNYAQLNFAEQQAFLGYNAFLFDPNSPNTYSSNVPGGSFYQENFISSSGYNGKFTGNFSTSYKNKLYLGLNLNAHFTDYVRTSSVYERNNNNPNLGVQEITFNNELYTYGAGFSLNLGAILQATEELRIGLAYESPTWYRLNDELRQNIVSVSTDGPDTFTDSFNPDVINVYPTYRLQTAQKVTGSASYVFNKKGLISADVAMKDYTTTTFSPVNEVPYQTVNTDLNASLQSALEIRIGGEYRIKQVSLRGGYRFEESPYKVDYAMGDLTGYSGGIGYNFGESKLDLAYSTSRRNHNQSFVSSGMNDTARIAAVQNNVTLTYSINF